MPNPRKPERAKLLIGTARADRLLKSDSSARLRTPPKAPQHLSLRASSEWKKIAAASVELGTLTQSDLRTLELLAQTLATEGDARDTLERDGMTVSTADGGLKPHPALRTMETARSQARALLSDFGLTPRGRQGVDTAPSKLAALPSPADEFLQ